MTEWPGEDRIILSPEGPAFVSRAPLTLVLSVWLVLLIRTQLASEKGEQKGGWAPGHPQSHLQTP